VGNSLDRREEPADAASVAFTGVRSQFTDTEACTFRSDHLHEANGLIVFRATAFAREATTIRHAAPELPAGLSLHVTHSGTYSYRVVGVKGPVSMDTSRHSWFVPAVNDIEFSLTPGVRLSNISVRLPDALVQDLAESYLGPLPLARIAARGNCDPFCLAIATDRTLFRIAGELLMDALTGAARRLYVEAKALELLAFSLEATGRHEKTRCWSASMPAERRKLLTVRERLAADPLDPPSIAELAHAVGLSPRRLDDGFREIFGVSVLRWLRDARLDRGRAMLLDDLPIKEIAFHLGYAHVNNFIAAFRVRFGEPPGSYRRTHNR